MSLLFPTTQDKDDIYFVVLTKEEGSGLGFSIAGGVDLEQKFITVRNGTCVFFGSQVW